jgi:hypothetical protein
MVRGEGCAISVEKDFACLDGSDENTAIRLSIRLGVESVEFPPTHNFNK